MEKISPIQKIFGIDIDMSKITHVGKVFGDMTGRRYIVYVQGGRNNIELSAGHPDSLGRSAFIKLWKSTKE